MPSLHHQSPAPPELRDAVVERYNARLGLALFIVYLIVYAGYVAVSAFAPKRMDELIGGLNVAVVSGFGLIGGAMVLAVVYSFLCRTPTAGGRS